MPLVGASRFAIAGGGLQELHGLGFFPIREFAGGDAFGSAPRGSSPISGSWSPDGARQGRPSPGRERHGLRVILLS